MLRERLVDKRLCVMKNKKLIVKRKKCRCKHDYYSWEQVLKYGQKRNIQKEKMHRGLITYIESREDNSINLAIGNEGNAVQ